MAAVAMPNEVGIVLVQPHFLPLRKPAISNPGTLCKDPFTGTIVRNDLCECRTFGSGIFRMCVIVVESSAVSENKITLYLFKSKRPTAVDFEIGRFIGILEQFTGSESTRILVRILEFVIPFSRGAMFFVRPHDFDRLVHNVHRIASLQSDSVFRLNPKSAFHDQMIAPSGGLLAAAFSRTGVTRTTFSGS